MALPLLVDKGLQTRVPFVKAHTLSTLSSIIDAAAPPQIAPQLPSLISALLESLSSLEPTLFNTLELHAERLGITQRRVEEGRMAVSNRTPMQSALERCAALVTAASVEAVVPVLTNMIRRGVLFGPVAFHCEGVKLVGVDARDVAGGCLIPGSRTLLMSMLWASEVFNWVGKGSVNSIRTPHNDQAWFGMLHGANSI